MAIDTFSITKEQVTSILHLQEGHFYELKRKEIKPAKLTITISAFANTDGGDLYIGVGERENKDGTKSRFWDGFTDIESANSHLQTIHEFFPFQQYFSIAFLKNEKRKGWILHVQIHKTKEITKASDGIPYIRRGAQNLPVKRHDDLQRLEYDKGITTYEQQTLTIPIELLTNSEISKYFIDNVVPSTGAEIWLRKQLLIQNQKPTVAGTILFSDEPQSALPKQCGIKIFRYKTRDLEGSRQTLAFDPITIEGCAYNQIYNAVKKTVEIIQSVQFLGDKGFEKIEYPFETLHEIITNAVLHRDYSLTSDVKIIIFDNRVEVISPGKLPGHITVRNILEEQLARNGAIVRFINKFPNPPNKDVGEGLKTAFQAMKKLRLKDPEIKEKENCVIVKIYHEQLASPEEIVMKYLESNIEISNSTGRDICGISTENQMKKIFQKLQSSGLLMRTPDKKGSSSTWCKLQKDLKRDSKQLTIFDIE
jgi:ATP-dependent DNA helicase RecG